MSSIVTSSTGLRRIEIIVGGKRHKIRLGRMPGKSVEKLKVRIDALAEARALRRRDPDAEKWCAELDVKLRQKLIAIGLLARREEETLKGLVDRFFKSRTHVKPATTAADKQATDSLIEFFGEKHLLQAITPIDAEEWRQDLIASGLATATIAKRIIKARSVFARAVKPWKLIESNPLDDLHTGSQKNDEKLRFINAEMSQAVLDACPNAEWRAIFALARWGGVRIPSEIAGMKWTDIVWDKHRMRVVCRKTEHHEGKEERWCPLFPEIDKALSELLEQAAPGAVYVFSEKRRSATNLRQSMMKIIRRAGLTPWPRLFQNLRSTRDTELNEKHPEHLVCDWLGNTPKVARKHYHQMLDSYFEQAAQKAAQTTDAKARQGNRDNPENAGKTALSDVGQTDQWAVQAQSLRRSLKKLLISHGCGAKSGALADEIVGFLHPSLPAARPAEGEVGR